MKVYIGMELNDGALVPEAGHMNNLTLFRTPQQAKEWFLERVRSYLENSYHEWVLDECSDLLVDDENANLKDIKSIDADRLAERIDRYIDREVEGDSPSASITIFQRYQDNWDENFSINIYVREVE